MKIFEELDLTQTNVVIGNHGVWLPDRKIKVPFQWSGRMQKYSKPGEASGPRETIVDEVCILRALAAEQMAPPVGDLVFFKNVISMHRRAWHCDPCGAYGYEIADAADFPLGKWDITRMRQLPISGSEGAWNDLLKPGNTIRGYLVDARRSQQDLLLWEGPREPLPSAYEDEGALVQRVHKECQFPPGERAIAYQDFCVKNHYVDQQNVGGTAGIGGCAPGPNWIRGQRRVVERAQQLGFQPVAGETVLDIGTQSGGFLQYAYSRMVASKLPESSWTPAGALAGVDINSSYIACARDLARNCDQNICFRQMDVVKEGAAFIKWVRAYFPDGVDHLLCLSLEKHLGDKYLFNLIDEIAAETTYIETNAVGKDLPPPNVSSTTIYPMKLKEEVERRGGEYLGDSTDRNIRRLYRIER